MYEHIGVKLLKPQTPFTPGKNRTPLSELKDPNSTYRHIRIKLAEFSTLSFTNSLVVNYFCQIADVSTTNWLAHPRHISRAQNLTRVYIRLRYTKATGQEILGRRKIKMQCGCFY